MKEINKNLTKRKIKENLESFNIDRKQLERYASFDYCFNYFQEKYEKGKIKEIAYPDNIQISCLQLGFYLASWGMYRGSTFLLQKSVKVFESLIKYIASKDCNVWGIDVDEYTDDNINKLINCGKIIEKELDVHETKKATDTLVTKIMLGVFGNVPAFDDYFISGSNLGKFNEHALKQIKIFYNKDKNSEVISSQAKKIKTLKYNSSDKGEMEYTRAKIIDMIFFEEGLEVSRKKVIKKAEKLAQKIRMKTKKQ